jgi:hypothetical protein
MWGYEYDEQKKQQRKKTAFSMLVGLVVIGIAAWVAVRLFQHQWSRPAVVLGGPEAVIWENFIRLLENGADPNVIDRNGRTAAPPGAWHGQRRAARALLTSGADPNRTDHNRENPLAHGGSSQPTGYGRDLDERRCPQQQQDPVRK